MVHDNGKVLPRMFIFQRTSQQMCDVMSELRATGKAGSQGSVDEVCVWGLPATEGGETLEQMGMTQTVSSTNSWNVLERGRSRRFSRP